MSDYFEDITIETEDIPSSRLRWPEADEEQLTFMRKVYDINLSWSSRNGTFVADIPGDQLDTIEGDHKARTEAASACRNLLAAARRKIQAEGVNVTIGVTSGYRSATRQLSLWQSYFPNFYRETASHRESLEGGEHGNKAAAYLAGYIRPKVAIPGFSNHQNGIAVDLLNIENGKSVLNKTKSPYPARWRESWLWGWLETNANSFGFYQNTNINEPWHWEYKKRTTENTESYIADSNEMENDESIPELLDRETTPAAETLYVKIDLGLRKERIFKYDDPRSDTASVQPMTGIFIPKNFVAAAEIDLLIYLHGHKSSALGKDKSINDYWNAKRFPHFAFREILNDSGRNIILVAPTLGPRSQTRTLTTDTGFSNFVSKVIASIAEHSQHYKDREAPTIKSIILACHSGGGNAMYKIAQLSEKNDDAKKISECWGFDCTYGPGDANALHKWASGNTHDLPRNLFIYYRNESGTQKQGDALKNKLLKLSNITVMELPNSEDHNLIPAKYIKQRLHELSEATESSYEEECGCDNEKFENDYTGENTIIFPSGEQLTITLGDEDEGEEYYDPNQSGNPLLDTSGTNKDIKLSTNFTAGEFAKSGAKKFDKARIDPDLISCLQAIRDHAGKSVTISSGYRSYGYNQRLAKGSKNVAKLSQHMSGRAADIKITGMTGFEIAKIALDVCSCEIGIGLAPGFAHIDVRGRFDVWRYAGDPDEMNELVEKIKSYQKSCIKRSASLENNFSSEAKNFMVRRSPLSAAIDLFKRGYINYDVLVAISNGERNIEVLTDMVFNYRHPLQNGLSSLINVTDSDYRTLRKEWQEIRSKIIEPIFRSENKNENYGEVANVEKNKLIGIDDPHGRRSWFHSGQRSAQQTTNRSAEAVNEPTKSKYANASMKMRQLAKQRDQEFFTENFFDLETLPNWGKNNWTPLGPSVIKNGQASNYPPVSGRVTSIAVGPAGERVYAGTANGGIWQSLDAGATWKPLDDYSTSPNHTSLLDADSLAVGAIAVAFGSRTDANHDTIFVGTGEHDEYFGIGIKYSPSSGNPGTWTREATNLEDKAVNRIAIDPDNRSLVFAATSAGLFQRPISGSKNRWKLITIGTAAHASGEVTDFIIAGSGSAKIYYAAFESDKIYQSTDAKKWTEIDGINSSSRKILGCGENDSSVVYCYDQNNRLYRLVSYNVSGKMNYRFILVNGIPNPVASQSGYSFLFGVDPSDANTVYLAGSWVLDSNPVNASDLSYTLNLFKGKISSSGSGATSTFTFPFNSANNWIKRFRGDGSTITEDSKIMTRDGTYVGSGIHPDGQTIAFGLEASGTKHDKNIVWIGCDGGLFRSLNGGVKGSFIHRNATIGITQTNYLAQRPDMDSVIFAGSQDNGTVRFWGDQVWHEEPQGDGGGIAVDPNNPFNILRQYIYSSLSRSTDGGISFKPTTLNTGSEPVPFYSRIAVSPSGVPTIAAFGTDRLYITEDWGLTWKSIPNNNVSDRLSQTISEVKIASSDNRTADSIYVAVKIQLLPSLLKTAVYRYKKSGGTWGTPIKIDTSSLPPDADITCIDIDDVAAGSFYVSLGGSGSFQRCYYYNGTNWQAAGPPTSSLDIACRALVLDPNNHNTVYLGSEVGVWQGIRKGNKWTWWPHSAGLPESAIIDLIIHQGARLLRAATYGRGVWEIALDEKTGRDIDLYFRANMADNGRIKSGTRFPWIRGAQDPTSRGRIIDIDSSPDIKVLRFTAGSNFIVSPTYLDFETNIHQSLDPVTGRATAHPSGVNQIFIKVRNRGLKSASVLNVKVLLLMANATSGVPNLPSGYTSHIQSQNSNPSWLGSSWKFVNRNFPFQYVPDNVDVRIPSIIGYVVNFTSLGILVPGSLVCFAAFVTTLNNDDKFTGSETDLNKLIMQDKHVAQRIVLIK